MLKIFPFHSQLRDYFKKQTKTWSWFSEQKVIQEHHETFKTDLLKNSYRIDKESEPGLHVSLENAKNKLGILLPVTVYQSQNIGYNNAQIVYMGNEAHIILSGSILKLLDETEMTSLLAHELSHILLFTLENNEFEITQRIINTIANDHNSELFYSETARLYNLYTELFCDLGSLLVCNDLEIVVNTLVKLHTGLEKVSAASYLKQANEILGRIEDGSSGDTHPEIYIRAKSLELFHSREMDYFTKIEKMVNGQNDLNQLNLFSKVEVYNLTKTLVSIVLKPKWTNSEHCIVLYKQYFKEYDKISDAFIDEDFKNKINNSKDTLRNYYAYVMLDFALCDRELLEPFAGHILDIAEQLNLGDNVKIVIKKELKLTEKSFKEFSQKSASALNSILESEHENTY